MSIRLEQLLKMYNSDSKDSFVVFAIAKEYQEQSQLNQAIKYYLLLKQQDPEYVGLYYHLAKTYESTQSFDLALETYREGIQIAERKKDLHALGELKNAKVNLEMEL